MKSLLSASIISLLSVSCTPKSGFEANRAPAVEEGSADADDGLLSEAELSKLSKEEMICQQGPRITNLVKKSDFSTVFSSICGSSETNTVYDDLIKSAYNGEGEPKVSIISSSSDEMLTTEIILAYALNVPMKDPSRFADYKTHDIFASGVNSEKSKMKIDVLKRTDFPGRRSIEAVELEYNILVAEGASIYDKRKTEFNTYLLKEDYRDVVLSTEHLTDARTNKYYHKTDGLTIGVKSDDGRTNLIFLNKLVIKERIDPSRVQQALIELNATVAKKIFEHIINTDI